MYFDIIFFLKKRLIAQNKGFKIRPVYIEKFWQMNVKFTATRELG